MFIQVLACPQSQEKTTRHHGSDRGCCLSSQCRVKTHNGTGYPCAYADTLGCLGNAAQHTPHKGTVSLLRHPGMKMVRDEEKLKSDPFRDLGIRNQRIRIVLFTG
jgi:hypothetical protein